MKFSALATTVALACASSADAFSFGFPFFGIGGSSSKPTGMPSIAGMPTNFGPGANGRPSATSATTATGAGSYGSFSRPIVPTMGPNAPAYSVAPTAGNSTSGWASQNPNQPNDATHRGNWAPGFDINTDYNVKWPSTGRVVKYALTLLNSTVSVGGSTKQMLTFNGQFPGPKIEANWGDTIQVTVTNGVTNNGTGIHWHGFRQFGTNTNDGVGGITECPLAPGDSRTYTFEATQYGTSWYHSHFSVQYGSGALGPIVVYGPASANYDIDLGTVIVNDVYPLTVYQEDWFAHRFGPPSAINYALNGQNIAVDGSAGTRAKFSFTPGKKHLIRLINTSVDALFKIQIDGHRFQVIQTDFVPIVPYYTTELSIAIGQRYMIVVEANQPSANYYFRAMAATDCTFNQNVGTGTANGIIGYSDFAYPAQLPNSTYWANHTTTCVDEPLASLVPIVQKAVDSSSFAANAVTEAVNIQVVTTSNDRYFLWTLGGISQSIEWNNPTIAQAVLGNTTFSAEKHVVQITQPNVWTYWVIQNQFFVPHPIHLHGHDFALLGQGSGTFDPSTDQSKLNFASPARRDVAMLVAQGWSVIAFESDNPGAWLMHCHIAWHAGEGLSLQFLERPADIPAKYKADVQGSQFQNNCAKWITYNTNPVWAQYDSGLKKRSLLNGEEDLDLEHSVKKRHSHGHAHGHARRLSNKLE